MFTEQVERLMALMQAHDWNYEYSDDHKRFRKGSGERREMRMILEKLNLHATLDMRWRGVNLKEMIMRLVLESMLEAVPETGIPNGHMYAAMMNLVTLETYGECIEGLKAAGALTEKAHVLKRGPKYQAALTGLKVPHNT